MRKGTIRIFLYILISIVFIQDATSQSEISIDSLTPDRKWVDSVFSSLDDDQKLGQLFMVAAFSNKPAKHIEDIEDQIKKNNVGGIIFFQGGPVRQANLTNHYQQISKVPLLIAMDGEWGLGMRLDKDSVMSFPKQMTLGAIQENQYIYQMGGEIARQCNRLGVHVNFAPVVDINSNPSNPVIGIRSFGENKENVYRKGRAYMLGLQHNGIMATAKHFPGHGDTDSDSHFDLPIIKHSKKRLSDIELYPFKKLIKDSLMSIMVAHINLPAYDSTPNMAATISKPIVTDLLRKELKFNGLIFTDALNMKAISKFYKPGEVDLQALIAGNDVLLYSENVSVAIKKINKALKDDFITREEIDLKVKKILYAKYWAGLHKIKLIETTKLYEDLNNSKAKSLQLLLYAKSITLIKNKKSFLPLGVVDTTSIACVSVGLDLNNPFQKMVDNYAQVTHFSLPKSTDIGGLDSLLQKLKNYKIVLISIHGTSGFNNKDHGISESTKQFVSQVHKQNITITSLFGNPYSLKYFTYCNNLICAYEDNEITQKLVPQIIFGAIKPEGKLPISPDPIFEVGTGVETNDNSSRLSYAYPENAALDSKTLSQIDTIVHKAIVDGATPGCQVLIAKDGMVVYNKSFGHLTYEKLQAVEPTTIYDIASISKVAGTLQAVMFLEERGIINIEKKASYYLTDLIGTNKEEIKIKDVLTHQAGLIPFIPHWKKTIDTMGLNKTYYCSSKTDTFCMEVFPGMFSLKSMEDSLWKWSVDSELLKKPKKQKSYDYIYSDLGFYIMKRIVEQQLNQPLEQFMQQNFYDPLGLTTMTYRPLLKFDPNRIAPTEDDKLFRHVQIRGTVHDQGAALMGGVAGHAGLFSNAHDLAVLMQMNLNLGTYGGLRYLLPSTIEEFTDTQFPKNRRGLGWDKPEPAGNGPTSNYASSSTFGHTGFTGTAAWADPEHQLIYIFLSNRIYPDANNNKLIKNGVRTKIQDIIYKSIINYQ